MESRLLFALCPCIPLLFYPLSSRSQIEDEASLWRRAKTETLLQHHDTALTLYKELLGQEGIVPTEVCYYLALSLHRVRASLDARQVLSGYFDTTSEEDSLYVRATALRKDIEQVVSQIKDCLLCDERGFRYQKDARCGGQGFIEKTCVSCQAKGEVPCVVCRGQGVTVRQNRLFMPRYEPCAACGGRLVQSCRRCGGDGKLSVLCPTCQGTGQRSSSVRCTHLPSGE